MAYPSTFLDLQNEVIRAVRLDATNDLQQVKDWLNQVYTDVAIETEAIETTGEALLTAGVYSYLLPTEVLRMKELTVQPMDGSGFGGPLNERGLDWILQQRAGSDQTTNTGTVTDYALIGYQQLELWPTPSDAATIAFYYIALPTALDDDVDVPVLQEPYVSKCLKFGAMSEAANFLYGADSQTVAAYDTKYGKALAQYKAHLRRRAGAHVVQLPVSQPGLLPPHNPSTDVRAWC